MESCLRRVGADRSTEQTCCRYCGITLPGFSYVFSQNFWSPRGVQTEGILVLASIWRPNRVTLNLVFSVGTICK